MNPSFVQETRITQDMRNMTSEDIKPLVEAYLGSDMMSTIACESGFRQFDTNGVVLRSHTHDVGIAQINVDVWGLKARELNFDIYTPIGNLEMARYIKSVQGKKAWVCWKLLTAK